MLEKHVDKDILYEVAMRKKIEKMHERNKERNASLNHGVSVVNLIGLTDQTKFQSITDPEDLVGQLPKIHMQSHL
jgi:hypothetical protein